jgi:hypothetical protein
MWRLRLYKCRHFIGQRTFANGGYSWLQKYCPNPNTPKCTIDEDLWRRYLVSV